MMDLPSYQNSEAKPCRRQWCQGALAGIIAATSAGISPQFVVGEEDNAGVMLPQTREAIDLGLSWLAKRQNPDGSLKANTYNRNTAVISLVGIAYLASGSTPGRGKYGSAIDRCVDFVLQSSDEKGMLCVKESTSHGPMYDHGFATLFLAEAYGMSQQPDLRAKLSQAVDLIVRSQHKEGGWRYEPRPVEADVSVTVCQIMALRAAKNAGITVPKETVERCTNYVKRCQNADGGFMYRSTGGPSRFPRSAAGIVALFSAGVYEGDEITRGLDYLEANIPPDEETERDSYALYGHYYAAQAMWHVGGERWKKWYAKTQQSLLAQQAKDGSWPDLISYEYGTAMACIVLQTPNGLVPIFQR